MIKKKNKWTDTLLIHFILIYESIINLPKFALLFLFSEIYVCNKRYDIP